MAVSGRHLWYRVFPLGSEFCGPFGARMIMRYSADASAELPEEVHAAAWNGPIEGMPMILPRQVHGTEIIRAADAPVLPERPDCDGVLLDYPGIRVALRFADCVPVLLWGEKPSPWMLGIHSGFRGTLANIVAEGASRLRKVLGARALHGASAWIGPAICHRCYFRSGSDPLASMIRESFDPQFWSESSYGVHPDLGGIIASQLVSEGMVPSHVRRSSLCTVCDSTFCLSYRKGDLVPRMWLSFEIRGGHNSGSGGDNRY